MSWYAHLSIIMYIAQDNFTIPYRDLWSRLRVFTLCLLALTALLCGCAEQKSTTAPQATEVAHLQVAPAEGTLEGTATESAKGLTYGFDGDKLFPHIRMKEGEQMSGHCFVRNTNPHIPVRSVPVTWSVVEGHLRSSRFSIDMTYPSGTQVGDWQIPLEGRSGSSGPASGRSYTFKLRFRQLIPTRLQNWMQEVEDNRLVCKMSIPGTHDTAADTGIGWVKTQEKSIKEQLKSGIRFLDIRLGYKDGVLKLCHGSAVFNKTLTEDVLRTTAEFLRDHPSETVIMTLKEDLGGDKQTYYQALTRALEADPSLSAYMAGNFRGDFTMKDLRGKMLLISRDGNFSTKSGRILSWPDNEAFSTTIEASEGGSTPLHVEDHYTAWAGDKVNYVATNVRKANTAFSSPDNEWFITFSSYTGPLGGGWPSTTTDYVDPHVLNILKGEEHFRTCGILVFNFAGKFDYGGKTGNGLTRAVINLNGIPQPED